MDEMRADIESHIFDVTGVDLGTLQELDNPVLAASIVRILREADQLGEEFLGFNSCI